MTDDEYYDSAAQGYRPFSEFMWFAHDSDGHVAALTTAGFAAVPMIVFNSKQRYFDFFKYIENLPRSCDYIVHQSVYIGLPDWLDVASRGLFAYDWDCISGAYKPNEPYRLLASPKKPLNISELPSEIRPYLTPIHFRTICFAKTSEVLSETEFPENNWSVYY